MGNEAWPQLQGSSSQGTLHSTPPGPCCKCSSFGVCCFSFGRVWGLVLPSTQATKGKRTVTTATDGPVLPGTQTQSTYHQSQRQGFWRERLFAAHNLCYKLLLNSLASFLCWSYQLDSQLFPAHDIALLVLSTCLFNTFTWGKAHCRGIGVQCRFRFAPNKDFPLSCCKTMGKSLDPSIAKIPMH